MSASAITREEAICMFFGVGYDPEKAYTTLRYIEKFGVLELCYEKGRPEDPILLATHKINSDPTKYCLYPPVSYFQHIIIALRLT